MENLLQERRHESKGVTFNIKLYGEADSYVIVGYLNDIAVTAPYTISLDAQLNYYLEQKDYLVERMFEIVSSDIDRGFYEKIM